MTADRLPEAEPIFQAAVDLPPETRDELLSQRCGDDVELLALVKHLLALHDRGMGSFLEPLAVETTSRMTPDRSHESISIGPYRILDTIGEGGMGTVYLAEQNQPIHRRVALKVIKPGMDSRQVIARFEVEREVLALMDHPNIAKVLDAGETEQSLPYFVMDLVTGESITDYCDRHTLSTRERLELFIPVCHAVQHAHQKGIIHRDLKPSNILVTMANGSPVPKVIDFGIAKATTASLTERTLLTQQGQLLGTPPYMSPEQAEIGPLDVDTRSDVYALAVILYELLAGPPFETESLRNVGLAEIQRIVREVEPPRPSTKVSSVGAEAEALAKRHRTGPRTLTRQLRGELDWIVMKGMEKERARRYQTANSFAEDIERYLNDEPVTASPPSTTYRVRKFARRHIRILATAAVLFVTLLAGISTTTWQAVRATREAQRARTAERLAADRYRIAKASMDRYVTIVMEDPKLQYGFDPLRNSLLMEAVPLYEPLVGQNAETPEERRVEASTLLRLGTLHAALANHRAAVSVYSRAIQMLSQPEGDTARDPRASGTIPVSLPGHAAGEQDLSPEIQRFYIDTIRHLHAIAPRPDDHPEYFATLATTQAVLGDCFARAGRWEEAARQFQQSLELAPGSFERSAKVATLLLACNQMDEYERLCRENSPPAHTFPDQWIFLMSPRGTEDWASLIEYCNRRFSDPEFPSLTHSVAAIQIGCAEYRRGRVDRAIDWLTEYADRVDGDYNPVRAHIVLAMALHDVGRSQEALRSLNHARLLMERYDTLKRSADLGLRWRGWLQSRILYQEAVIVLGVNDERGVSPGDAYAQLVNQKRSKR